MSPCVGVQSPEIVLMVTDLPAPLSPASAVILPGGTVRFTPLRACTAPKILLTPRNSSSGGPSAMSVPPVVLRRSVSTRGRPPACHVEPAWTDFSYGRQYPAGHGRPTT